jgi:hypothetical protein
MRGLGHERDSLEWEIAVEAGRGHRFAIPDKRRSGAVASKLGQIGYYEAVVEGIFKGERKKSIEQGIIGVEQLNQRGHS